MLYAFEHLQDYPDDTQIIIFKINTISRNEENFPKKSPILPPFSLTSSLTSSPEMHANTKNKTDENKIPRPHLRRYPMSNAHFALVNMVSLNFHFDYPPVHYSV